MIIYSCQINNHENKTTDTSTHEEHGGYYHGHLYGYLCLGDTGSLNRPSRKLFIRYTKT
jgi:hypothetical protein